MDWAMVGAIGEFPIFTTVGGELGLTPEETLRLSLYFNAMLRDAENRWRRARFATCIGERTPPAIFPT